MKGNILADLTQQPQSSRLQALKNLASQLPVANQQVAAGQQAARDLQLQQAIAKAPAAAPIAATAQATGASQAEAAGKQQVQGAQNTLQQGTQIGQLGLGEQKAQSESKVAGLQAGAKEQEIAGVQRLASIDEAAKQELYDKQLQFQKDTAGNTLFNQRQLMDYAASKAQSDEDFKNYANSANLIQQRNLQMMQVAQEKLMEKLKQEATRAEQDKDQKTAEEIKQMQYDINQKIGKAKNQAANENAKQDAIFGTFSAGTKIAMA